MGLGVSVWGLLGLAILVLITPALFLCVGVLLFLRILRIALHLLNLVARVFPLFRALGDSQN